MSFESALETEVFQRVGGTGCVELARGIQLNPELMSEDLSLVNVEATTSRAFNSQRIVV